MNAQGFISCGCSKCHGKSASCSEFEEHAGSRDRRPADGIFLKGKLASLQWASSFMAGQPVALPRLVDFWVYSLHVQSSSSILASRS
jgi:hypothetical protein